MAAFRDPICIFLLYSLGENMPTVEVSRCNGKVDVAVRRLKRLLDKLGIGKRMRATERHIKDSEKRRQKRMAAVKRQKKKISKSGNAQRRHVRRRTT